MGEWRLMRELEAGQMIHLDRPQERAVVVSGKAVRQDKRDDYDRKIGERDGWLLVFEYRTGRDAGTRDYVIGDPDWKVRLA